jgi:hypothetical protein
MFPLCVECGSVIANWSYLLAGGLDLTRKLRINHHSFELIAKNGINNPRKNRLR